MLKGPVIRFGNRHRRWLAGVFGLLWFTGVLWLLFHYFLATEGAWGPRPHPLEIWWLRLHGLVAFAALVAVGSVLPVHVRRAWELRKNRASGLAMNAAVTWLALTGYALYYFADPEARPWLPWLHWVVGCAVPALIVLHVRRGRRAVALGGPERGREERRFRIWPGRGGVFADSPERRDTAMSEGIRTRANT